MDKSSFQVNTSTLVPLPTQEQEPGKKNGHKRTERLVDCKEGTLYYRVEVDGDGPGVYLLTGKDEENRRSRILLGGWIEVIPTPDEETGVYENSITIRLSHPDIEGDKVLTLTRNGKIRESYYELEKLVHTPTTFQDKDMVLQALKALARKARLAHPELYFRPSDVLGWSDSGHKWASVNGYIKEHEVYIGNGMSKVPRQWPQKISPEYKALPIVIRAETIKLLLDFWHETETLFLFALLGTCEYVMYPLHTGTARWQLEMFAPSGWMKTTVSNYMLRMFFGSGYAYDTPTTMNSQDSKVGKNIVHSRLPYHAYLAYDMNTKPGQIEYEKQQTERIESLTMFGDNDNGPAKANLDGKSLSERPQHKGAVVRLGEANPRMYTLLLGKRSTESRAVTYVVERTSSGMSQVLLTQSMEIASRYHELDALMIAHVQWLASFSTEEQVQRWKALNDLASEKINEYYLTSDYEKCHTRRFEQLRNLVTGLLSYCQFLRAMEAGINGVSINGASELASYIEDTLPLFIMERLEDSHELMAQFDEQEGASPLHAQAQAIMEAVRDNLVTGKFYLASVPEDFSIPVEYLGYESKNIPRRNANRLGYITQEGTYVVVDDLPFETLVRQASKIDKRISFTNLASLLKALKKVGATVWDGTGTKHRVREGKDERPYRICFLPVTVWPIICNGGRDSKDSRDKSPEDRPEADSVSLPESKDSSRDKSQKDSRDTPIYEDMSVDSVDTQAEEPGAGSREPVTTVEFSASARQPELNHTPRALLPVCPVCHSNHKVRILLTGNGYHCTDCNYSFELTERMNEHVG